MFTLERCLHNELICSQLGSNLKKRQAETTTTFQEDLETTTPTATTQLSTTTFKDEETTETTETTLTDETTLTSADLISLKFSEPERDTKRLCGAAFSLTR